MAIREVPQLVWVREACSVAWEGGSVALVKGEAWSASHPVVLEYPGHFSSAPSLVRGVETTRQAPGGTRSL